VTPPGTGGPYDRATAQEAVVVQQSANPGSTGTGPPTSASRLGFGAIAALAGGGLLVVFMLQNRQDVTLNFLVWSFTWPLWLFTVVDATLGAVLWIGIGVLRRHRRRVARRADRRD
jgi:uncharacterized integral membrane protein